MILILSRYGETEFVDVGKAISIKLVSMVDRTEVHIMFPGGKTLVLEYDKEFVGDITDEEVLFELWMTRKELYPIPGKYEKSRWFRAKDVSVKWKWE